MIAEDIVVPWYKQYDYWVPKSVLSVVLSLVDQEIARNYRSFDYTPQYDDEDPDRHPALRLAKGLNHIFQRATRYKLLDKDETRLVTTLGDLAALNDEDKVFLHRLKTPLNRYCISEAIASYRAEVRDYERTMDQAESPKEVRWEKRQIAELKDHIKSQEKQLEVPDPVSVPEIFENLLTFNVSFEIPQRIRTNHMHILGLPDSGKSTLIEHLATQDILSGAGVVVIAPKGEFLNRLAARTPPERLIHFHPGNELPVNIFDLGIGKGEVAVDQAIELINFILSSLLENAKPTERQKTVISNVSRLLLKYPGANFRVFRQLLREPVLPEAFNDALKQLSKDTRDWFEFDFASKAKEGYQSVKAELGWRLDAILSQNTSIARLFNHESTAINMRSVMDGGVLIVDTSFARYQELGSAFIGRFFIGLLRIAYQQRKTGVPQKPLYIFIDEVYSYVTEGLTTFFDTAREYTVGLTVAHQRLNQLTPQLRDAVHGTAIKFVGAINADDAYEMAKHIRGSEPSSLQDKTPGHFVFYAKNFTKQPFQIRVSPKALNKLPTYNHTRAHHVAQEPPPQSTPVGERKERFDDDA